MKLAFACILAITACTVDTDTDTGTDESALSGADVTHTYYSDATYTHPIGFVEVGVACGPGRRSSGTLSSKWYSIDSTPCRQGIGAVSCYQWQVYQITGSGSDADIDGDYAEVTCPPDITFELGY